MKDPFVQEVRKYRMEHTKRFNGDLQRICGDLRQFEQTLGDRVITLAPRRIKHTRGRRRLAIDRA